jgi:hypothetical protein
MGRRKVMMKKLISRFPILLTISLLTCMIYSPDSDGQREEKKIERGPYFLLRAPSPEYRVANVNLDIMSEELFPGMSKITEGPFDKGGRTQTLFDKKRKTEVKIATAVYADVSAAEDAALDLLNSVSSILKPGSARAGQIGMHSWYMTSPDGSGTVVFVYNNALFSVFSSNYNLAEKSAQTIVTYLKEGRDGVTLGRRPEIERGERDDRVP